MRRGACWFNMGADDDRLFLNSSLREEYLEYIFLAGMSREAWMRRQNLEILRCATDSQGYDLILETEDAQRHVQLKSSYLGASTPNVKVSLNLARKPSGCVIWIGFDKDTLKQTEFRFFGAEPNKPLPQLGDTIAKHTKANRKGEKLERPNLRVLAKGKFDVLTSYGEVFERLFG